MHLPHLLAGHWPHHIQYFNPGGWAADESAAPSARALRPLLCPRAILRASYSALRPTRQQLNASAFAGDKPATARPPAPCFHDMYSTAPAAARHKEQPPPARRVPPGLRLLRIES
jgi:hypothetical protein